MCWRVLILDVDLSIFKQDLQLVFVLRHHQRLDMKSKQTLRFPTFLKQTVNEQQMTNEVNDRSRSSSIAFKFFWHVKFELNRKGRHTRLSQLNLCFESNF